MQERHEATASATSPAASGPAGSHFEGQVGAYYLLSMLTGAEPRGLLGTTIDRIEFQRAAEGRPLDDVIVHAHDSRGKTVVLEIQVKRSITFAPADAVFRAVVGQIAKTYCGPDFWNSRYELAIATAKTTRKIDGPYQDVLTWARQLGSASTFMARIDRPGSANDDMRTFVRTFRSHLREAGTADDDETVWQLLRKILILVFDFTAQGSASEDLAKERAARALHPDDGSQAGNLWTTLVELAIQVAASGGDRTRDVLIDDLKRRLFRLAGERRYATARAALSEASRAALADIGDRVGDVMLTRHERIAEVHAALDGGRYVEIRGDAGVGKSGVLKHFAEQTGAEAQTIVLSPGRTTPRGWTAMRAVLGFDGSARDLLADIAGDGGAVLFVDNLDLFGDDDRRTVIDLVRAAAEVPGLAVVATARRSFGVEEPSWLPADTLDRLGRAEPIVIGELSAVEVDELRHAAPRLSALLAENHPARDVTRNLFRLARLANRPADEPAPRTEIDMADQWWRTADGHIDGDHRERARLLRALAEQALSRPEPLDVSHRPPKAVDALVRSETLRDLSNDRVTFRHDVLREWAIGLLLSSDPSMIERLPLERPAPAVLARGVELAARIALERAADAAGWQWLLDRLSREGTHGSWRRVVLLALARSEIGPELLTRALGILLADRATLLRELIRTVMAVDVAPASHLFAAAGMDPTTIPTNFDIPSGPSWHRLIQWLVALGENLPATAIPDVADLYTSWSLGMLGLDPLTPLLLPWLYRWLTEIEAARDVEDFCDRREPFSGGLDHHNVGALESNLRTGFLLFCNRTPRLAVEYLRSLSQRRHNDDVVRGILKFRGALAQAAPAELAELTAATLIRQRSPEERGRGGPLEGPFDYVDHDFLPASPAQGPFLELLTHAPQHGLGLIRRLVDHAIGFYSGGREYGSDAFVIPFPDGARAFPWVRSYGWSRDAGGAYCVESALMALEAWAHRRIEIGEVFEDVLGDVLGSPGAPAAYLLVAVDLVLSHWPTSRVAVVPFLACPELLCIDRQRHLNDNFEIPDIFGLKALQKEPAGAATIESLKKRPSRRYTLDQLLGHHALYGPVELRNMLRDLLQRAAERLGTPDEQSDLGDPEFMTVHALNMVDPSNWPEVTITREDGSQATVRQYVSPEAESRHLKALQDRSRDRMADGNMQTAIGVALDPARSSPAFARAAVEWAQKAPTGPRTTEDGDHSSMREEAVVTAAMMCMRDGEVELRARHGEWVRGVFASALAKQDDPVHRFRAGLRFNPIAMVFAGMIHALKDRATADAIRALLDVTVRPAAAHGFGAAAVTLAAIDERLPRSLLRCAFSACVRPSRQWDQSKEEIAACAERHRQRVAAAVDAEVVWLAGGRGEPPWPSFPSEETMPRKRRMLGRQDWHEASDQRPFVAEERVDHQAAALWLSQARSIVAVSKRPWLLELVRAYAGWTATANGAGLTEDEEVSRPPREWNDVYFELLAYCLAELAPVEVDALALSLIRSLPDKPFFDATTRFLRCLDDVYFNDCGLQTATAVRIRSGLAQRLTASRGWRWVAPGRDGSIEVHIGPAIAAFFFNDYGYFQPSKAYLLPKGIDRLTPFLPVLEKLVAEAPCLFLGVVTLNLFEVSPRSEHLRFVVAAAKAWIASFPDAKDFWIDHAIGRRVCALIDAAWRHEPTLLDTDPPLRHELDGLLAYLVRLGVAEATRLEQALANASKSGD